MRASAYKLSGAPLVNNKLILSINSARRNTARGALLHAPINNSPLINKPASVPGVSQFHVASTPKSRRCVRPLVSKASTQPTSNSRRRGASGRNKESSNRPAVLTWQATIKVSKATKSSLLKLIQLYQARESNGSGHQPVSHDKTGRAQSPKPKA